MKNQTTNFYFVAIVVAIVGGLIVGKILPIFGRRTEAYEDSEEFID